MACSTSYQRRGVLGGYEDTKIAEDTYVIEVLATGRPVENVRERLEETRATLTTLVGEVQP